eukprot:3021856-Rhodomonas_salina.1
MFEPPVPDHSLRSHNQLCAAGEWVQGHDECLGHVVNVDANAGAVGHLSVPRSSNVADLSLIHISEPTRPRLI